MQIEQLLGIYNPWWQGGQASFEGLATYERPVFHSIVHDLTTLRQILAITGPRRVGKTTLLRQIVRKFLKEGKPAKQLVYYSLDDPALFRPGVDPGALIEKVILELRKRAENEKVILLLDEVQRLPRWELFLKKYYDLEYPIHFIISGSASSPIFKKSRESLLGRVKDYHVLPFSFSEYLQFHLAGFPVLQQELNSVRETGNDLKGMLVGDLHQIATEKVPIQPLTMEFWQQAQFFFDKYVQEGGFPEVWALPTREQQIDYLYDNQIKKVIYEDLVLAAEFRKPEELKRFYISLLEKPGREVNLTHVANETGINVQQVEKYLPLLEMTDLISHVQKFRKSAMRVRRGNLKFYLVDLALRNAILRITDSLLKDEQTMGLYAENLVFNALQRWKGILAVDYFRERMEEVDFIVHIQPQTYLPIEVKYRNSIQAGDLQALGAFSRRFDCAKPIVVCKKAEDFGRHIHAFYLPLIQFLLLFS